MESKRTNLEMLQRLWSVDGDEATFYLAFMDAKFWVTFSKSDLTSLSRV